MYNELQRQVIRDADMVSGIIEYILWLADQDDGLQLTAGQMATFYREYIEKGRWPGEVIEDLGLPSYPDWEL